MSKKSSLKAIPGQMPKSWPVGKFEVSSLTAAEVRSNFNSPQMKAILKDKNLARLFLAEIGAIPKSQK